MVEVQSPTVPHSRTEVDSHEADKAALIVRLDELLEKYLHTLDAYQKTRDQLSKQLSSVCLENPLEYLHAAELIQL